MICSALRQVKTVTLAVAITGLGSAQGSDLSKFVQQALEQQYGRPATGQELNLHVNLAQDQGPLESYMVMCSSDNYFDTQCQHDLETYVAKLYQTFLMRQPQPDEVQFWVNQFYQGGVDRISVVRHFCEANQVTQLPSFPPADRYPAYRPPATASAISEDLIAKANLFAGTIQRELAGTRFGERLLDKAAALLTVCTQYRDAVNSPRTTGQQVNLAAQNLEAALKDVQKQFRAVPGASRECQQILLQISQLVSAARTAPGGDTSFTLRPTPPPSLGQPIACPPRCAGVDELVEDIHQYAWGLQGLQDDNPLFMRLSRDVNGLGVQLGALDDIPSQDVRQARQAMTNILTQAARVSQQIRQVPLNVQQGWWNIEHGLRQLAEQFGLRGDFVVNTNQPVVINRPAWNQLPYQNNNSFGNCDRNQRLVELSDELIQSCVDSIRALTPIGLRKQEAAELCLSLQDLAHVTQGFRQAAAIGASGAQLTNELTTLQAQYRQTSQFFLQLVSRDATLNTPTFAHAGQITQQMTQLAAQGGGY